jgi:putative heme degradation protein
VHEAITRVFKALDTEILDQAQKSNLEICQFGGTTALVALHIGRVCPTEQFRVLRFCCSATGHLQALSCFS